MNRPRRTHIQRQGTLLICVLVCMAVATSLVMTMLARTMRTRKEVRLLEQRVQTELILDAAVMRAHQRLEDNENYQGEVWQLSDAVSRFDDAVAEIQVEPTSKGTIKLRVTAKLGPSTSQTQQTYFQIISIPNEPNTKRDSQEQ